MNHLRFLLYLRKLIMPAFISLGFLITSSLLYAAPININSADVPTITSNLTDIGPVKATSIIEYRELNGPFKTAEDLLKVKGIGEKTLEKNRASLRFEEVIQESSQDHSPLE